MKKKIMISIYFLLFAMPVLGFAMEKREPKPNVSAYEQAKENAKFKRSEDVFNNKANKEIRAEGRAEKEATQAKKKMQEVKDEEEGQVRMKF